MATYFARDKDGNQVNIIEIMPEQIPEWEELTGLKCELPQREVIEEEGAEEVAEAESEEEASVEPEKTEAVEEV